MNVTLEQALKTGKIAGAYLIEGSTEQAVLAEADAFLQRLFCVDGNACGHCSACAKYKAQNHADILRVEADGKSIKVDAVRDIPAFVYQKSYEGGYKAVLIPDAEQMTEQAQNALLKVLEEPPRDTVFVLGARNAKNLLPTILSRCIIVRTRAAVENAEKQLMETFGLPTLKARVLLKAAGGDYHLAARYAADGYFEIREDMVLALSRLFGAKNMATSAVEKLLLKHEEQLEEALEVALVFLNDVLVYKHTRDDMRVCNIDKLAELQKFARLSDMKLVHVADELTKFITKYEQCPGVNRKLVLTGTLLGILEVTV